MQRQQPESPQVNRDQSGYFSVATIFALASGVGGAISVVRISGPETRAVLKVLTGRPDWEPKLAKLCRLKTSAGAAIDEALVIYFEGPRSFTGEDVAELHLHSSPYILRTVFDELRHLGCRSALAGEFSFRAVRNGKMSISQAKAVADLIASESRPAAELALEKLSGSQNQLLGKIASDLRRITVLSEVGIDFSDQDVEEVSLPTLKRSLSELQKVLQVLKSSFERGGRIQDGVTVSLIGLPNAGKSSFFNALLGEDRSIVSDIPGTTRDIVRERLVLESEGLSVSFRLSDTAGVRPTEDEIEKIGVERSIRAARGADLILWVLDGSDRSPDSQMALLKHWEELGSPSGRSVGILTKSDIEGNAFNNRSFFEGRMPFVVCSSLSGDGMDEAAALMVRTCGHWVARSSGEVVLTREEDLRSVEEALEHIGRALLSPEEDLFASDLKLALRSLSTLIGDTVPDDILGAIFSGFCIGK